MVYPDHRSPPWLTEDATRDRSNRLLDYRATPAPKLTFNSADELTPSLARRKDLKMRIPRDGEQCFHGIVNTDSTAT